MYDLVPTPPPLPPPEPPLPAAVRALTGEDGLPAELPLSFWRRGWVQNILPWVTSVVIHLGLIILVLATYRVAAKFGKVLQEQIIIPDASLAPDPGGVPNPGLSDERDRSASQNLDSSITESKGFAHSAVDLAEAMKMPNSGGGTDSGMLIGMGNSGRGKSGIGPADTGGALAQFGNPGGGQIGPHGRVFGSGGNAMRIVYVCDATGSMLGKIDLLKLELDKSVQQLQPVQAFNVIFFQDSVHNPSSHIDLASDLVMATVSNKKKLYAFLQDVVAQSSTHVIPAMTAAFRSPTRPELIYLLTDGAFENETSDVVIAAINRLNADKRVKVNTILFLGRDIDPDELKEASAAMRKIAKENGGVYNQVMISELEN